MLQQTAPGFTVSMMFSMRVCLDVLLVFHIQERVNNRFADQSKVKKVIKQELTHLLLVVLGKQRPLGIAGHSVRMLCT